MGKRTKKTLKKDQQKDDELNKLNDMITFLEEKYQRTVKYSCVHCLKTAYESEINGITGYVTDDELVESSNNKLKYK
tara:strand:+ start:272 stop:502 length:231 start_codon:yes stop_codon:yes gene_type:complete